MFESIRKSINAIKAYCDQATDADWEEAIRKIKTECNAAELELEELEFQNGE